MSKFILSNNVEIPNPGFGTFKTEAGEVAINAVKSAIECGYRHIDTASVYENEVSVGQGIKASGINREDVFVTSKLWNTERGYDKTIKAFQKSLSDLDLEYLDLYLIHWPANKKQFSNWQEINLDTWKAFEKLYKDGYIRSIGFSNFLPHHMQPVIDYCEIKPMVDQIEYHIGLQQEETVKFCKENNIVVEAWSPLARGQIINNEVVKSMAEKYGVSTARLAIKYCSQHDILPLPKSVTYERIKSNFDLNSFTINDNDMKILDDFNTIGRVGSHPDTVEY